MYDVIIIGGGPAGLAASIYAARAGASVLVLEELSLGGVAAATPVIENYPGFESISGYELADKMSAQAAKCGASVYYGKAEKIEDGEIKKVTLAGGEILSCRALVLALGSSPRKLGVEGEADMLGMGLSYCATCDGNFFRGKKVIVAGKGTHAKSAAEYLAPIASEVTVIDPELTPVVKFNGKPLESVTVRDSGVERDIECSGLFVSLGYAPNVSLAEKLVRTDPHGYIICDEKMSTSLAGIFAAGDIVKKPLRQIATAVSDGAIAGQFAAAYARAKK